jgi:glycosyltransferase involved in cell wall biosynthesis
MTRSLVFLAYHYPPMVGAASERAASFARHLPGLGWDMRVVTVDGGLFHRDPANEPPPVPVVRTRSAEVSRVVARLRHGSAPADSGAVSEGEAAGASGVARRLIRDFVYVPDAQASWIPFAVAGIRRAVAEAPSPSVLLTTSVPYSAHLAGQRAAKRAGVRWAAEFRDPWAHIDPAIRARSRARMALDERLERRVVESADAVIVTSASTRARLIERYPKLPAERFHVVLNGFEPSAGVPSPPAASEPLVLVHAGSVPDHARLEPLLEGIAAAVAGGGGPIVLRVYSPPERWRSAVASLPRSPDWLVLEGMVSPAAVHESIRRSSAAVLISPSETPDEHISAKFLEYLGAGRPVIAAMHDSSEMTELGHRYGDVRVLPEYSADAVAAEVSRLVEQHRAGDLQAPARSGLPIADLTRAAQARVLSEILETLV